MTRRASVYMLRAAGRHPFDGWAVEGAADAWFAIGPEEATTYRTRKVAMEARARLRAEYDLQTKVVQFAEVER